MEVILEDKHVVTLLLEYLHSRKLFDSALALERETGILLATDESLPEHSKYLRNLCLNGEWDNVVFYLEPFTESDQSSTRRLNFLVLRQKYVEILHFITVNKNCSPEHKESLMKLMADIRHLSSEDELMQMHKLTITNKYENTKSIAVSRFECFQDILELLGPYFGYYKPTTPDASGDHDKSLTTLTALESIVIDSLLLEECCKSCRDQAFKVTNDSYQSTLPVLSSSSIEVRGTSPATNATVLFWILSLKQKEIFRQPYQVEELKVETKKINNRDVAAQNPGSLTPSKSPRISASMKMSNLLPDHISHPPVAKSLQMLNSHKPRTGTMAAKLSESGPMRFSDFTAENGNNVNNNNNTSSQDSNDDASTNLAENIVIDQPNDANTSESPLTKVNGWTKAHLEQDGRNSIEEADGTNEVREFKLTDSARTEVSANEQISMGTTSAKTGTEESSSIDVNSSHEQFLSEQRLLKRQKEEFLRNLEEKEKINADIRKRLMESVPVSPQPIQEFLSTKSVDSEASSSIRSNYSPRSPRPFRNLECTQLDYLEDTHAIRTMAFHPSGQVYVVGSNSKTLRICSVPREITTTIGGNGHDIKDVDNVKRMSPKAAPVITAKLNYHKGSVYCSAWNDEGSLLATGSNDKLVKVIGFDILGKHLDDNPKDLLMHRGIVREVTFLHDSNNTLASAGVDQMVHISDCKQELSIHSLAGHSSQILGLYSWSRDMLASCSEDKTTRIWDVRTPRCVSIIGVGGSSPSVATSICVDNPGYSLAMGTDRAKIGIYDLRGGKTRVHYDCHNDEIRSVRFNPVFENLLLSSSYDGSVVITDVDGLLSEVDPNSSHLHHWKRLTESSNKLIQCRWHPNGDAFASTSVDKTCKIYLKVYS